MISSTVFVMKMDHIWFHFSLHDEYCQLSTVEINNPRGLRYRVWHPWCLALLLLQLRQRLASASEHCRFLPRLSAYFPLLIDHLPCSLPPPLFRCECENSISPFPSIIQSYSSSIFSVVNTPRQRSALCSYVPYWVPHWNTTLHRVRSRQHSLKYE